jgi:hypothetical protein
VVAGTSSERRSDIGYTGELYLDPRGGLRGDHSTNGTGVTMRRPSEREGEILIYGLEGRAISGARKR